MPADTHALVIYDAHAPSRLGLGVLLRAQPWVERCHLAADLATAVDLTRAQRPRVAVLDVSGGVGAVGHACEALRRVHTTVAIVLTTRCPAATGGAVAARDAGAAAYLPADAGAPEIVNAVRAVAAGASSLASPPSSSPAHRAALTAREAEVLRWLATGATNREIADALHLSTDAIKKRSSSLYRKLGVRNRTEAAALAVG